MNQLQNGNLGSSNQPHPNNPSQPTDAGNVPNTPQSPNPPNVNDLADNTSGKLPSGPNNNGGVPGINYGNRPPKSFSQNMQNLAANVIDTVIGGTQRVIDGVGSIFSKFG